jgi:CheY-like chemotaxis protein
MLRVLLVDDDLEVLESLGDWLKRSYEVTVASGFPEAILALANGPLPDVVICDLDLSPFSGEDLLVVLAARYPSICRVLHTGSPRSQLSGTVAHHVFWKGDDLEGLEEIIRACRLQRRIA